MSTKRKDIFAVSLLFFVLAFFLSSASAGRDVGGKTFYVAANIWYEKPDAIYSTNFHRGAIISVGTKVTIRDVSEEKIRFSDEKGISYTFLFVKKHTDGKTTVWDYFDSYFSADNPLRPGGPFEKFSSEEKRNINSGSLAEGMKKEAVLMAYGLPPSHRTPSLESDIWVYWINRFVTVSVIFRDGRVAEMRKGA